MMFPTALQPIRYHATHCRCPSGVLDCPELTSEAVQFYGDGGTANEASHLIPVPADRKLNRAERRGLSAQVRQSKRRKAKRRKARR